MDLHTYLKKLNKSERDSFAANCKTTIGYLRKAISKGQRLGEALAVNIEFFSQAEVPCEVTRPDITWIRVPDHEWPHQAGRPLADYQDAA